MLDVNLLREEPERVKHNLARRPGNYAELVDKFLEIDTQWRHSVSRLNAVRSQKNTVSEEIAQLKQEGKSADEKIQEMQHVSKQLEELEGRQEELEQERHRLLKQIPNLMHSSVPDGQGEEDNPEIRRWGEPPQFDFNPTDHRTILENLSVLDGERAAKISGHGFYFMKGDLVRLDFALQRFALDFLEQRGFTVINPPYMMNSDAYAGVAPLEDFKELMYQISNYDQHLIATSEHPVGAMFMNETVSANELPLKFAGFSPCFRKELGAHGKYTKGLFRTHQFNKIEQFVYAHPDQSWDLFEQLMQNAEELYQHLQLHYRIVEICTGDQGAMKARQYDAEFWMADGQFREFGSNSNITDYSARNLNIKWRPGEGQKPAGFVHTLNNTAIATSRTLIAIVEQYQQEDGTVKIPSALQPYMNGKQYLGESAYT